MCQLNVVLEREGKRETVMESITKLEVTEQGVILSTYFEDPMTLDDVCVKCIDLLGGSVVLASGKPSGRC
ncbi:MAG: CooT family nickel-binding protein [Candidatus Electrothrix sp. AR4]|nr:CooT family nickel-binding protein [Candidatus Electrothrix sp. AR4]